MYYPPKTYIDPLVQLRTKTGATFTLAQRETTSTTEKTKTGQDSLLFLIELHATVTIVPSRPVKKLSARQEPPWRRGKAQSP